MLGAICGDVIGRPYEFEHPVRTKDFELFVKGSRFSDDTVMTAAIASAVMYGRGYTESMVEFGLRHIEDGYGKGFKAWLLDENRKQGASWGNGSAMRVSAIAWLATDLKQTILFAKQSALPSHASPEGITGAIAAAAAVRLAIEGWEPKDIRAKITELSGYDLSRSVDEIRENYPRFKVSCQESVPEAIICALEATSFEDAVRNAVSLGNDADTQAAIAGSIVEPMFGIPSFIIENSISTLTGDIQAVFDEFINRTDEIRAKTKAGPFVR